MASVTSWKYAVPPCTGSACDIQDEAALVVVVAKSGPVSICVNAASWDPYMSGVFTGDCNPAYNDMDHCVVFGRVTGVACVVPFVSWQSSLA